MKYFLKIMGLLLLIAGSMMAIFWEKGSYGVQPVHGTCFGLIPTQEMIATNFPSATKSFTLYDRTFVYLVDKSTPTAYCLGYME